MMIRINLLPVRAVKKREMGKQLLVLFAVIIVGGLTGNWMWYSDRADEFKRNAEANSKTQQKITELEKVIGEVNNISKRKKEFEDKLKILADLRKGRTGPVRMLDALATAMPKKVWLNSFDEKEGTVVVEGTAMSHDDVAEFMRALAGIVWTPKGMGRLVDQKRDAKTSRVELLGSGGALEDFPVTEVGTFFTKIELKSSSAKPKVEGVNKGVGFQLTMAASYTI